MNVLLIGGGGREHALAWALARGDRCSKLFAAPGNPGIGEIATCVSLNPSDHAAVAAFCSDTGIDLVVIGPEAPLVAGLADDLRAADIAVFGPSKAAAALEGSKGFTKDFCAEFGVPTAAYRRFSDQTAALDYLADVTLPIVIKADGLAAGKGVIIAETLEAARSAVEDCFGGRFGEAGAEVVIEAFLEGEEASFFALTDGTSIVAMPTAQDHKRVGDGDTGPNTGGMGAYSPAPVMTEALIDETMERIIAPTVRGMAVRGTPFQGVLYAGLMITDAGPQLIEYNVRFGDPECQVLMMRLQSDITDALYATATGGLDALELKWRDEPALTVVMAAEGYPGTPAKGGEIDLSGIGGDDDVVVFHAGTAESDGRLVANGGRVLAVTARGHSFSDVQAKAYSAAADVRWDDGFYRRDIGYRAIERERRDD
ncbi:MAG: phosphoribosylamine--glycine ligase [Pseudomonadota bacterium]